MQPDRILLRGGMIVTGDQAGAVIPDASLLIVGNRITTIIHPGEQVPSFPDCEVVDISNMIVIPGFIQTHLHLCQTLFRGRADDFALLDWLRERIFPFEAAHTAESIYASAMIGIAELLRSGTTTILDMGSVHHEEEIIRALGESGMRAFVGKAMMDLNDLYPPLKESTEQSLVTTRQLTERWHNSFDGRIRCAITPRFVLSCSDKLLHGAREMLNHFADVLFHTHASENVGEIEAVRKRTGMENIAFLYHLGLLSERACLAHCIHLNEDETDILHATASNVTHCPSSNLKLGSGIAGIPRLMAKKINVSLGADGAPCNNSLDMFHEMRLASLIQKPFHGTTSMNAKTVFDMATRNGARALGLENETGSIEVGKKADLVLLDLNNLWDPVNSSDYVYSAIVYSATPENVDSVMIDGHWRYRKKELVEIDKQKISSDARVQLQRLLGRMH